MERKHSGPSRSQFRKSSGVFLSLGVFCLALSLCSGISLAQEIQKTAADEIKLDYLQVSPPAYPDVARQRGWEGTVILKALVDKDGTCSQVAVEKSSGHDILDDAATEAVKDWEFSPARMGDSPYPALTRIPVRFVLSGKK